MKGGTGKFRCRNKQENEKKTKAEAQRERERESEKNTKKMANILRKNITFESFGRPLIVLLCNRPSGKRKCQWKAELARVGQVARWKEACGMWRIICNAKWTPLKGVVDCCVKLLHCIRNENGAQQDN